MDPARWQAVREVFDRAVAVDEAQRARVLDEACKGDPELREEVAALLASHAKAGDFLDRPAVEEALRVVDRAGGRLEPGDRIDRYIIVREIGRGGMGVVYLAHRDGDFAHEVAIKVIKRGLDSEEILHRFLNERQILASLNHPHIARLFDGGTTAAGQPYFVMEYVVGEPLLQYCETHSSGLDERLALFQMVCAAVQHAHQNLVVHRDLKPSNVIVTPEGQVKLLDFGIAKLVDAETAGAATTLTRMARPLTPDYASPEQIAGGPITTASDIYSLGVMLYELLTGHRPMEFGETPPDLMARHAQETIPQRPSAAARTADRARMLRGDLDNIILMALRKEPERRYRSVEQLSEDIRRHRAGLPVSAQHDTFGYRASKFVRRHRVAVGAALLLVISLVAGMATTMWQAREARRQQRVAETEKDKAQAISRFVQGMLSSPVVSQQGTAVKVLDVLDESRARAGVELASQPAVLAEVYSTLGASYMQLANYDPAEECFRAALNLATTAYGADSLQAGSAENLLANVTYQRGRYGESEEHSRRSLDIYTRAGHRESKDAADDLSMIGLLLSNKGDRARAAPYYEEALAIFRKLGLEETREASTTRNNLGALYMQAGDLDRAAKYYAEAIDIYRKSASAYSQISLATTLQNLGAVYKLRGDLDRAEPLIRETIDLRRRYLGNAHPHIAIALAHLADLQYRRKAYAEAETTARDAMALQRYLPPTHADRARSLVVLGQVLTATGRLQEAEKRLRAAVAIRRAVMTSSNSLLPVTEGALGECLMRQKRYEEAERLLVESHRAIEAIEGKSGANTREAVAKLAALYEGRDPARAAHYRGLLAAEGRH
jgi:eukaryotic-like serine/threonine-protein kinase